ncbi:MAG: hypothetical protein ACRDIB_07650, partial [Ardenticatenaceae bacterium]
MRYVTYQVKVLFGPLFYLLPLLLAGSLVALLLDNASRELRLGYVLYIVEVFLPPLAVLLITDLILKEKEEGTLELVAVKVSLPALFLRRLLLVWLYIGLLLAAFLWV